MKVNLQKFSFTRTLHESLLQFKHREKSNPRYLEKFKKFSTESAEKFLETIASYGFGTIQKIRTSECAKAVTYFQRNNLQDLGAIASKSMNGNIEDNIFLASAYFSL